MSFNSLKDVVGHVETALQFMKNSKSNSRDNEGDGLAYGNNYYPGHDQHYQQPPPHYPPPQQPNYNQPPPPPPGWIQQWDQNSQRYYYLEQATGRTQWEPPMHPGYAHHQQQQWGGEPARDGNGSPAPYQGSPAPYQGSPMPYQGSPGPFQAPHRSNSNPPPLSPGQIPRHDSLPPGCSYDMKTGQIVNSMHPPVGHHSAPVKYW